MAWKRQIRVNSVKKFRLPNFLETRAAFNKNSPKNDEDKVEKHENMSEQVSEEKHEETDEKLPNKIASEAIEDNKIAEVTEGEETDLEEEVPCVTSEE